MLAFITAGTVVFAVAALSIAEPLIVSAKRATLKENFYLLGSPFKSTAAVNATPLALFSPYYESTLLLASFPYSPPPYEAFNLTGCVCCYGVANTSTDAARCRGVLQSMIATRFQSTLVQFDSNVDGASGAVFFLQANGTHGLFEFKKGFLAYKGDADHWTQCTGPMEVPVVRPSSSFVLAAG
jgi:hypothetical protein